MLVGAIAIAVVLFITGLVYLFKSISEQLQIQHEINLKLPPGKQFEPVFWWYGTHESFRKLQDELMNDSPRPRRLRKFRLLGCALLISGILVLLMTLTKQGFIPAK